MPILLLLGGTAGGIALGWFFFRCKHFGNGDRPAAQLPDSETSPAGTPSLIGDANHSPIDHEPPGELYGRRENVAAEKPWFSGAELFDPSYKGPPPHPMTSEAPVMVLDDSPLDYTHGLPLPDFLEVGDHVIEIAHPGKIHDAGTTILCYWVSGLAPPFDVAWRRSAPLGEPWYLPGSNMIGVRLSRPTLGAKVINALTGGEWDGVIPMIQRDNVSAGLLHASAAAAKAGLVKAGTGVGKTAAGAFWLISVAPYLIVAAAIAALGAVAYKVSK